MKGGIMSYSTIKDFAIEFNLNNLLSLDDDQFINGLANDELFICFLKELIENDHYTIETSKNYRSEEAIASLYHLKVLRTALNLKTEQFFQEASFLLDPISPDVVAVWKSLQVRFFNTPLGGRKLLNNLLLSSNGEYFGKLVDDYEKRNPFALYPTSSFRYSSGHIVNTEDYQQIEANMELKTFTSVKVDENTLDLNNPLLKDHYQPYGQCVCLIDRNIEDIYGEKFDDYFSYHNIVLKKLVYRAMEVDKHISTVGRIVEDFRKLGVNKNEPILIVGGGVIGDIGAFATSIYHRSTPYIMLSTSIVSAIDSGPSPRSCCDAGGFKNLLGSFHAPILNISDRSFFKSLRTSWVRHGIAEIHKMAVIKDYELFQIMEETGIDVMKTHFGTINCNPSDPVVDVSQKIIGLALKSYVESEYNNLHEVHSIRNHAYGHSLSANFELKSGLLHGHAISVEMALDAYLSYKRSLVTEAEMHRILKLFSDFELSIWDDILLDRDCILQGYDKVLQKRGGVLAIPVPKGIGGCAYINDLTKPELLDLIGDYQSIVNNYPRKGIGVEPMCADAGLEDPNTIYEETEELEPAV